MSNTLKIAFLSLTTTYLSSLAAMQPETQLFDCLEDPQATIEAIRNGADVNAKGVMGMSALHAMAYTDDTEIAQILLDNGASIDSQDDDGQTPLHLACTRLDRIKIIQFLLDNGADIDSSTIFGMTPLFNATLWNHNHYGLLLLSRGADFEKSTNAGRNPENFNNPIINNQIHNQRKEIQKRFSAQQIISIDNSCKLPEFELVKLIAAYAKPELQECGMAMKRTLDGIAAARP